MAGDGATFEIGIRDLSSGQPGSSPDADQAKALAELQAIRQQLEATGRGPIAPASYEHRPQSITPPVPPVPPLPPRAEGLSENEWKELLRRFGPALAKVIAEQGEVAGQRLKPQSPQMPLSQDVQTPGKPVSPGQAQTAPRPEPRERTTAPAGGSALDAVARRLDQIASRLGTLIDQLRQQARPRTPLPSAPPQSPPVFAPPPAQQGTQPQPPTRQPSAPSQPSPVPPYRSPSPPASGPPPVPSTRQPSTPPRGGPPPVPPRPPSPPGGGGPPPIPPYRNPPTPPGVGGPPNPPSPQTPNPTGAGSWFNPGNLKSLAGALVAAKALEVGLATTARNIEMIGVGLSDVARNNYGQLLNHTFDALIANAREIPVVGGLFAAGINTATAPIKAFTSALDGFLDRARQLQNYDPSLALAGANAETRAVLADIREAQELGPRLARLVDSQSKFNNELREIFLPLKGPVIDKLSELLDGLRQTIQDVHGIAEKMGVTSETGQRVLGEAGRAFAEGVLRQLAGQGAGGAIATTAKAALEYLRRQAEHLRRIEQQGEKNKDNTAPMNAFYALGALSDVPANPDVVREQVERGGLRGVPLPGF